MFSFNNCDNTAKHNIKDLIANDRLEHVIAVRSQVVCKICDLKNTCKIPFKKDCKKLLESSDRLCNNNWDNTAKRNRAMYQRLSTGLRIANYRNEKIRFLTLTSSKKPKWYTKKDGTQEQRTIKQSWTILRKRIKRLFGWNLNKYICFRTSEGYGVLHIIYWGGQYLPQKWLSDQWQQIHNASITFIELVRKNTVNGLVGYLLDRYLLNQPIERMSYGWGWAWLGFCNSWKHFKEVYNGLRVGKAGNYQEIIQKRGYVPFELRRSYKAVSGWKVILANYRVTSRQTKITKYLPNG